jgi:hypothetical protein
MANVYELLEFHLSPRGFRQSTEDVISKTLGHQLDISINQLKKISEKVGEVSIPVNGDYMIPAIFKKFKSALQNDKVSFDKRELRTLAFALSYSESGLSSIFSNENELKVALELITSNWRDPFLIGIIDCYLRNWDTENRKSKNHLAVFIDEKIKSYSGNRNTIITFKNKHKYFDLKNGDSVLGYELALKNISIKEANKYLSLPESWYTYPYFSKVITTYYEKKSGELNDYLIDFESALESHKNPTTNKRLLSKFIIQANQPEYSILQDKVKYLAFKFIGDPENKSVWAEYSNAIEQEKSDLFNARIILNEWITREFINVFFNICINDERRKRFWLKYTHKISSFKVYGPSFTQALLKRDERISKYLDTRFVSVQSNRDISAFILYMGDYMFIEFSDAGYAFYAYKINGTYRPNLNYRLNSVDELRNSYMPMLAYRTGVYINGTSPEGRLSHNDGDLRWEEVFSYWIKNIAQIDA